MSDWQLFGTHPVGHSSGGDSVIVHTSSHSGGIGIVFVVMGNAVVVTSWKTVSLKSMLSLKAKC